VKFSQGGRLTVHVSQPKITLQTGETISHYRLWRDLVAAEWESSTEPSM
jgi:quercetin dioxygenase-like cupin family protein